MTDTPDQNQQGSQGNPQSADADNAEEAAVGLKLPEAVQEIMKKQAEAQQRADDSSSRIFFSQAGDSGVPLWLITFTDIMALMLTFFVLLYTMSVPKVEVWEEFTEGMTQGFSTARSPKFMSGNFDTISISKLDLSEALSLSYLESLLQDVVNRNTSLENVVIIPQSKQLILSLPNDLLFEAGQADVNAQGKRALFALGGPLSRIRNRIEVVGHADPRPIQNKEGKYASNWELSIARAASVGGVLKNVGYSRDVIIKGLSSGRYDDLGEEIAEAQRLNLSRRVDIVIMRDDGSQRLLGNGL